MFKSSGWKTTLAGIIVMMAGFASAAPQLFVKWPWVSPLANYIMVGGCGAIGLLARDQHSDPPKS